MEGQEAGSDARQAIPSFIPLLKCGGWLRKTSSLNTVMNKTHVSPLCGMTFLFLASLRQMSPQLLRPCFLSRHLLMSQQTLRNVPPIVFVQDKKYAAVMEVRLLHNFLFTVSTFVCVKLYVEVLNIQKNNVYRF